MASEEDIESFVGITGANRTAAERVLELCGSELEQAIQLWFTDEDLQRSLSNVGSSAAAATTAPASRPSRPNRAQIGREDAQGVIHIDSDDDDVPMTEDEADDGEEVASVARRAQEEEDAAMAKRLQDELFSGPAGADEASDAVRAPMARTTETLIGPSFGGEDDDDDAHAAVLEQLRRRQQARARPTNNPFAQSVWEDNSGAPGSASSGSGRASHLANLFRPPYDLMSQMSWDEARDEGKDRKKWILVNLQDTSIFSCQALNRDIWKDEAITSLVRENFIFLQYDKNNMAAEQYLTFYFPNESHQNPDNYPHVSIIDPRTGEQVKVFSGSPFPNALEFHAQLAEFLDRYSLSENSKNPVSKAKRPERVVDVDRMTEDEMLEMALQNSLNANGGTKQPNIQDPDELTKSIGALAENGQSSTGSAELATGEPAASTPQESAFARISSDRPHVEPPADPKTTTRLQVRNPPGRIIRRFRLDEPVSRIYEWLKAEPLPGKEGVEFELKSMPPNSADLIEHLDETIQEAGLANAVVMLEFI